MAMEMR